MIYRDRREAGSTLAAKLLPKYGNRNDVLVLALPRGGVPVGYEVAAALGAPLDLFVVRKLGVPGQPELAMGAISSGGVRVLNQEVLDLINVPEWQIEQVAEAEQQELELRERRYRGDKPPVQVSGKIVILVDDGLATGSTMRAAVQALRRQGPKQIVVAVPVAAPSTCKQLETEVDEVICPATPQAFYAVGQWYREFEQTTDEEVRELLRLAADRAEHRTV